MAKSKGVLAVTEATDVAAAKQLLESEQTTLETLRTRCSGVESDISAAKEVRRQNLLGAERGDGSSVRAVDEAKKTIDAGADRLESLRIAISEQEQRVRAAETALAAAQCEEARSKVRDAGNRCAELLEKFGLLATEMVTIIAEYERIASAGASAARPYLPEHDNQVANVGAHRWQFVRSIPGELRDTVERHPLCHFLSIPNGPESVLLGWNAMASRLEPRSADAPPPMAA